MRLIISTLNKIYTLHEENMIRMKYKRAIWQFYMCYNMALAVLEEKDKQAKKKSNIYRKIMLSENKLNSSDFKKIQTFMKQDTGVIFKALTILEELKESKYTTLDYARDPYNIGILSYEFANQ